MSNALNIGISGLNAASSELNTISNNIANSSTTGFKSSSVQFADVYSSTGVGGGVFVSDVSSDYAQGALEYTSNSLDMAISGDGFFITKDTNGNTSYTRAGDFQMDKDGYITNSQGMKVQGYGVDANGNMMTGATTSLQIDKGDQPARATTEVTLGANLDASSKAPEVGTFDSSNPDSYNFTTSTMVYDSQGTPKTVSAYYVKGTEENSWNVHYMSDGKELTTDPVNLTFDASGQLVTPADGQVALTVPGTGGGDISFDMDISELTQFGSPSSVSSTSQNGTMPGSYTGLQVSNDGNIFATYSNGETRLQGVVAIATFPNNNGLANAGNTSWQATAESGTPLIGIPGTGGNGALESGALEMSNVDMTSELVNMVVAQSNYQANAKTISASNEMTQILMNTI